MVGGAEEAEGVFEADEFGGVAPVGGGRTELVGCAHGVCWGLLELIQLGFGGGGVYVLEDDEASWGFCDLDFGRVVVNASIRLLGVEEVCEVGGELA